MSLLDTIIEKIGIRNAGESVAEDAESQVLIASLLALVAGSDGGISRDENSRIVNLLGRRFGLAPDDAMDLVSRTVDEHASPDQLDELIESVNDTLSGPQKEDLMFMVLCVIAADDQKDAGEIKLLNKLVDTFRLPDAVMQRMYQGNFDGLFY